MSEVRGRIHQTDKHSWLKSLKFNNKNIEKIKFYLTILYITILYISQHNLLYKSI